MLGSKLDNLFKDNLKNVNFYIISDYVNIYGIRDGFVLYVRSDLLTKSVKMYSKDIKGFINGIEELFKDKLYLKTNWQDIRLNCIDTNESQLKLF